MKIYSEYNTEFQRYDFCCALDDGRQIFTYLDSDLSVKTPYETINYLVSWINKCYDASKE